MGLLAAARAPVLNDVSTDLDDPPAYVRARHGSLPEAWKPRIREAYADLAPLRVTVTAAAAADAQPTDTGTAWSRASSAILEAVLAAAKAMPRWEVVLTHTETNEVVVEAVAMTRLMRFRDDVVVRLRPDTPERAAAGSSDAGTVVCVDMRSKSRVGRGDLGANAARIRAFMEQLRSEASKRGMRAE